MFLPREEVKSEESYADNAFTSKKTWKLPKNNFFKELHKYQSKIGEAVTLKNGDNPYPDYFKPINHSSLNGYDVKIVNAGNEDLILFSTNLNLDRDQAVFIPKNSHNKILLHNQGDTLRFYTGKSFKKPVANSKKTKKKTLSGQPFCKDYFRR